ncbi:hypothetical protein KPL76_02960 [Subtercola sp. PAMC28395]|uniref:hypothetical protein n=1 Tax=Subtercola sp. PAMC28395 TaxID=2846775 RepID=UPI001C0D957F|nr:hypothetical protein [Subtercola sp. PAMC28395]QWT24382.1 hypothetical protein KPL76_02960 [Subtercola sp. PAMC28395]
MGSLSSCIYVVTSVLFPNRELVTPNELHGAEHVTTRKDESVVVTLHAETLYLRSGSVPIALSDVWPESATLLDKTKFSPESVLERGGLVNMRFSLWPDAGRMRIVLPAQLLGIWARWSSDVYIDVLRSEDENTAEDLPDRCEIVLDMAERRIGADVEIPGGNRSVISEPDAILRQEQFESAIDGLVSTSAHHAKAPLSSSPDRRYLVISFGPGRLGSGIVLTGAIVSRLAQLSTDVLLKVA